MTIKAPCPTCAAKFRVPDAAAGKSFICKQCGAKVRVPEPGTEPDTDLTTQFAVGFSQSTKSKPSLPIIPLVIGGGVVLVAALVIMAIAISGGGDQANEPADGGLAITLDLSSTPPNTSRPTDPTTSPIVDQQSQQPPSFSLPPDLVDKPRETSPPSVEPPADRPAPPPTNTWRAGPDPLVQPFKIDPQLDLDIGRRLNHHLFPPQTPSPFLAVGDKVVDPKYSIIDLRSGETVWELIGEYPRYVKASNARDIALSPDGQQLVFLGDDGKDDYMEVYSKDGDEKKLPMGQRSSSMRVLFSSSKQLLIFKRVQFVGGRIIAYDTDTWRERWVSETTEKASGFHYRIAISPGGRYLAFRTGTGTKGYTIVLLDTTSGQQVGQIPLELNVLDMIEDLAFSPDGSRLAAAYKVHEAGRQVELWDMSTGEQITRVQINRERVRGSRYRFETFKLIDNSYLACFDGDLFVGLETGDAISTAEWEFGGQLKTKQVRVLHNTNAIHFKRESDSNRLGAQPMDLDEIFQRLGGSEQASGE